MKVLVTGGLGFIGSNYIRLLLTEGLGSEIERVVNLDCLSYAGNPANLADLCEDPRYRFVRGSIGDSGLIAEILLTEGVDAVVNFAAESHVDRSIDSPEPFFENNLMGTLRLLEAVRRWLGKGSRPGFRFLHVSTDEVYGTLGPEDPAFSETTPYAPNSPYAASKAGSDFIVRAGFHTFRMPVLTTNCSNNYGPFQFPEKLIPLITLNAIEGRDLPIYGDGANIRDWLFVQDHCRAVHSVLLEGRIGETYNIGGRCERTNLQIVDTICDLLDRRLPREDGKSYREQKRFVADRPGHDRRYAINCEKITTELGWEPLESFETGLARTVDWYLDHRDWCREITEGRYQRQRLGTSSSEN